MTIFHGAGSSPALDILCLAGATIFHASSLYAEAAFFSFFVGYIRLTFA
jgi:hypothetical protein